MTALFPLPPPSNPDSSCWSGHYHAQQCKLAPYPTAVQILARRLQDAADNAEEGDHQRRYEDEGQVAHRASMNISLYEMKGH